MILPIYDSNLPELHQVCEPVAVFDDSIVELINDMRDTMRGANGIGLAAPQVGKPIRMIVLEYVDEKNPREDIPFLALVNPKITWRSHHLSQFLEGCLSVPGVEANVLRPEKIKVVGLNQFGKPIEVKAGGLMARIIQHEIDHLDGVIFTDLVEVDALKDCAIRDYPMIKQA